MNEFGYFTVWNGGGFKPSGLSYSGCPNPLAMQYDKNTSKRPLSTGTATAAPI